MTVVRPFVDTDYPAICRVANEVWPDHPQSEEERRHRDATQDAKLSHTRWVAEEGGEVVAWAHLGQDAIVYHPQKFDFDVQVLAGHRRRGVGSALYETLLAEANRQEAIHLRTYHREDMAVGVAFLAGLGYRPELWECESALDLKAFDPTPWQERVAAGEDPRRVDAWGVLLVETADGFVRVFLIDEHSPLAAAGVAPGARLERLGRTVVDNLLHLEGLLLQTAGESVTATFDPGGEVVLPMP